MLFGGDVALDWGYNELVPNAAEDPGWPFRKLQPLIGAADVFMINCEHPITGRGEPADKSFVFRMDPVLVDAFVEGGVDIVTLANNHVMDYGVEGLMDTIAVLDSRGIAHVGAGMDLQEARNSREEILRRHGVPADRRMQ